jgi:hypothetical protein
MVSRPTEAPLNSLWFPTHDFFNCRTTKEATCGTGICENAVIKWVLKKQNKTIGLDLSAQGRVQWRKRMTTESKLWVSQKVGHILTS